MFHVFERTKVCVYVVVFIVHYLLVMWGSEKKNRLDSLSVISGSILYICICSIFKKKKHNKALYANFLRKTDHTQVFFKLPEMNLNLVLQIMLCKFYI